MCWWKPPSPFIFMDEGTHRPRPIKKNTNWCARAYFYGYIWMKDIINFMCSKLKDRTLLFSSLPLCCFFHSFRSKENVPCPRENLVKVLCFSLVFPRCRDQEENLTLSENKSLHPHIMSFGLTYLRNTKNRDKDPEKRSSCADWPAQPEQQSGLWYWPTLPEQQGWSNNNSIHVIHTHSYLINLVILPQPDQ